jgi:signal transduction histidine kinase
MAEREAESEHQAQILVRARKQVRQMDELLEALLEFARSGASPAPGAAADLAEVLENVVTEMRLAAEAQGAALEIAPCPPSRVACPAGALASVVGNLLQNALKFLPAGGQALPRVAVRVSPQGKRVRVEVEDNGPGIPPGQEHAIFQPFVRGDRTRPGIGLGLATVKRIVEAYGGKVGVESRLGQGSRFWFELPRMA